MVEVLEYHKDRFNKAFKKAKDNNQDSVIEALKTGYDYGYEEAYWDSRNTLLSWIVKYDLPDSLSEYVEHLKNKPRPQIMSK